MVLRTLPNLAWPVARLLAWLLPAHLLFMARKHTQFCDTLWCNHQATLRKAEEVTQHRAPNMVFSMGLNKEEWRTPQSAWSVPKQAKAESGWGFGSAVRSVSLLNYHCEVYRRGFISFLSEGQLGSLQNSALLLSETSSKRRRKP